MINFDRFTLPNGLKVLVYEDKTTPMAVVNVLYDVGARDEDPEQTGFAHLFEHLMFGGSINIPNYDGPLQRVGGENNAFTSNDITNYYITLPAVNIETAFWLESDRMLGLAFNEKNLEVQRNVVCEEFKQRYLNQPYGDVWLRLRPLAYQQHPYRWSTIGKELAHIEDARIQDVKNFFIKHYNPQNAILAVGGDITTKAVKPLIEKWFGDIPGGEKPSRNLPKEPLQTKARQETIQADVPLDAIYMAFHMSNRANIRFYVADIMSDILSNGNASRLVKNLVKENKIFSEINAYHTQSLDPGLFVVEGKLLPTIPMQHAEDAIWYELDKLKKNLIDKDELTRAKNKLESTFVFSEMNLLDTTMNLAFFELLGDADMINQEVKNYQSIQENMVMKEAKEILQKDNASTLYYLANKKAKAS